MATINDIKLNTVIKFKTYNTTDPNTYIGSIKSFMTYDTVRPYLDVEAYHASVVNIVGPNNIPPKEELTYFGMRLKDSGEMIYLALEWIDENTLEIIEKMGSLNIDIINITNDDIDTIISILASNGYVGIVKEFQEEVNYE